MKVLTNLNPLKRLSFFALLTVFLTIYLVIFIFFKNVAINASFEAMVVFGTTVLPVIIPFSTLLLIFNYSINELNLDKNHFLYLVLKYLFIITAGYPTGVKTATLLNNENSDINALKRLAFITSISSPLVVINCVGRLTFKSTCFGVIMFLAQILSAKIAVDLSIKNSNGAISFPKKEELQTDIKENAIAILISATTTLFFYTITKTTVDILLPSALNRPLLIGSIFGLIETNYGIKYFSLIISPLSISLANFILAFGGAPIILQTLIYCKQLKMRTAEVLKIKLLQSAICFILTYFFTVIFFQIAL
jgi:hypothetical protein